MSQKVKTGLKCAAVIIGVIIIPLCYSLFYLGAFWDPYSNLQTLPVAVVNQDKGEKIGGSFRNLGDEISSQLKENNSLKWTFTDEKDAKDGVADKKYYAYIIIPEDFSKNIASAGTTDKKTGVIYYESNEKRNYLASQILSRAVLELEEEIRGKVNEQMTEQLVSQIKGVPDSLRELNDGLGKLDNGAQTLKDGAVKLDAGLLEAQTGAKKLAGGAKQLPTLQSAIQKLNSGAHTLSGNLSLLASGTADLAQSSAKLDLLIQGITDADTGAQSLNTNLSAYVAQINQLIPALPVDAATKQKLTATGTALSQGAQKLAGGTSALKASESNLGDLKAAIALLKSNVDKLSAGAADLSNGTAQLAASTAQLSELKSGIDQLESALAQLKDGSAQLVSGTDTLKQGIDTANTGITGAINDADAQMKSTDGLASYAKEPVTIDKSALNPVPNYGTAFAPYFISLSLWVGALMMFFGIFLDPSKRMKRLARGSGSPLLRVLVFFCIGLAQSLLLAVVAQFGLHLTINHVAGFYLAIILGSIVFTAIVQFLLVHLADVGKFLAILFLILQLTSCGGTFPMETVPQFFNVLYKFMPMTYTVELLKEVVSGSDMAYAWHNALILIGIFVVFGGATVALSIVKRNKAIQEEAAGK